MSGFAKHPIYFVTKLPAYARSAALALSKSQGCYVVDSRTQGAFFFMVHVGVDYCRCGGTDKHIPDKVIAHGPGRVYTFGAEDEARFALECLVSGAEPTQGLPFVEIRAARRARS
jgi:hypothetical protein